MAITEILSPATEPKKKIKNPDGSFSTERTISVSGDGKHYLIPTIIDGKQYTEDEAVEMFKAGTNKPVAVSDSLEELNKYAPERSAAKGLNLAEGGVLDLIRKPKTDDLPAWAEADVQKESLPDWAKADLEETELDADFEALKSSPLDERHALLSTGLFRAVDKDGYDVKPEGEFYVVPTEEAKRTGAHLKYQPEFKLSDIPAAAVSIAEGLGKGVFKMSTPGQIATGIKAYQEGGIPAVIENQKKLVPSLLEGVAQNLEDYTGVASNLISRPIGKLTVPEEQRPGVQYEYDVQDAIKRQRSAEGKSIIGETLRAAGAPEDLAQGVDKMVDQDIALANSIWADPAFIATGGLAELSKFSKAEQAARAAKRMSLITEGMKTLSLQDAVKAADAKLLAETSLWKRPITTLPIVKPVAEAVTGNETVNRLASIVTRAIGNPGATLLQGAGKGLQAAGKGLQRASDWVLSPGMGPGMVRGLIASPAFSSGPVSGGLAVLGAMALGDLPKVRGAIQAGRKIATLGDLLETAGRAAKMGGDAKALRTAGSLAAERGTMEAGARAGGVPLEPTDTSRFRILKSPFLRNVTKITSNVVDPALRGAMVGGVFSAAAGQDAEEGMGPGLVFGLAGHGFGSFGKLLNPKLRDPAAMAAFAQYKLDSLKPSERAAWKNQDPRAIDFFGDVDFMVKAANSAIKTPDGKPAIDVSYAGTPEEVRAAFMAGTDGQTLLAQKAQQQAVLNDPAASDAQRSEAQARIAMIDNTIEKSSRASGWVTRDPATGKVKMVVNASRDLNLGQISHEGLGHVVDQIDNVLGDESPLKDAREALVASLIGVETQNEAGQNVALPGAYTEADLNRLAEGYFARLGIAPKYDTVIVNPETGETKQVLSEETRQDVLKELIAEHTNVFSKNAMAGNKDIVQHALDVVNSTDAEIAQMLADSEAAGGNQSELFKGQIIRNTPEIERAAAERLLSFVEATSSADASLRTVGDYVGTPDTVPITKRVIVNEAKNAHQAYADAKTYDEAVAARQAIDVLAESNVYATSAKPRSVAQAEAEREFTLQNGRKPTPTELNELTEKILDESPRVLVNEKQALYKAGDTPVLLTKRQQEMAHVDQTKTIKAALAGVPLDDPDGMTLQTTADGKEIFNGKYFTPAQMKAIRAVPNALLPKSIKDNIAEINDVLRKGKGGLVEFVYHQAIKRGGNIPRTFRSVVPFSFGVTKADNTIVRAWDATAIYRDLQKEASKRKSSLLDPFREVDETDYSQAMERFAASMQKFGQNHAEGKSGRTDLDPNPDKAKAKAEAIAQFLGFGKDSNVDLDSDKGKARNYVRAFRMDRTYGLKESLADPLPLNYWETKRGNYMPEVEGELPAPLKDDPRLKGLLYNGVADYGDGPVHYFTDSANDGTFVVVGEPTPDAVAAKMQAQAGRFTNRPETVMAGRKGPEGVFYGNNVKSGQVALPGRGEGVRWIEGTDNSGTGSDAPVADAVEQGLIEIPGWLKERLKGKDVSDGTWDMDLVGMISLKEQGVEVAHFPSTTTPGAVVSIDLRKFDKERATAELLANLLPAGTGDKHSFFMPEIDDTHYLELARDPEGNKAELQRMVESAAKMAGYTQRASKGYYPKDYETGEPLNIIARPSDFPAFNRGESGVRIAGFFSEASDVAQRFAKGISKEAVVGKFFLSLSSPFVIDAKGGKAGDFQFGESGKPFRDAIRSGKYDSIIIKNTSDEGTIFVALSPSQIKSADPVTRDAQGNIIPLSQRFNTGSNDIRYMPAMDEEANPNPGFYSGLERIVADQKQDKFTADQIKAIITGKAKAEEVKWTGILPAIDRIAEENGGKVTKQQIIDHLRNEGAVRFEEVKMGDRDKSGEWEETKDGGFKRKIGNRWTFIWPQEDGTAYGQGPSKYNQKFDSVEAAQNYYDAQDVSTSRNPTKYSQYQLPGGENYKEVVLALPPVRESYNTGNSRVMRPHETQGMDNERFWFIKTPDQTFQIPKKNHPTAQSAFDYVLRDKQPTPSALFNYTSSHFADVPNYVAHMRTNERVDSDGNPGLFIEELQSDRAQAGRKQGFAQKLSAKESKELSDLEGRAAVVRRMGGGAEEPANPRLEELRKKTSGIPDMPYSKDWPVQMFKRALRDAVSSGKEWVGWTPGDVQAERYDLSKQVEKLSAKKNSDGSFEIRVLPKDGTLPRDIDVASENELAATVGKDLAEKISKQEVGMRPEYSGLDLKVGGEGMKGFYDNILPKEIGKYVKQWGGKVEKDSIAKGYQIQGRVKNGEWGNGGYTTSRTEAEKTLNQRQKSSPNAEWRILPEETPIWRVSITPEMKEGVSKGQALFMPEVVEGTNLLAVHNLDENKLRNILKIGGLPAPSMAVIRADKSKFGSFGDITLVADKDMVNHSVDPKTRAFNADIYSPRYPQVSYKYPEVDTKKIASALKGVKDGIDGLPDSYSYTVDALFSNLEEKGARYAMENSPVVWIKYLKDTDSVPTGLEKLEPWDRGEAIRRAAKDSPGFQSWLDGFEKSLDLNPKEEIFNGYTNMGRRRYKPHTVENVVKMLVKELKDGEGFNYGVPSIRAKSAKEFKNIKAMQKDREKIISTEDMEKLKEEYNAEFMKLAEEMLPLRTGGKNSGFGALDAISDDFKAYIDGDFAHLREMYPDGVPSDKIRPFIEKLRNAPTEYFEAKVRRPVQLQEFVGAVVPEGTSPEIIAELEKRGIDVQTYDKKSAEDRMAKVRQIGEYRKALFMPETQAASIAPAEPLKIPKLPAWALRDMEERPKSIGEIVSNNQPSRSLSNVPAYR